MWVNYMNIYAKCQETIHSFAAIRLLCHKRPWMQISVFQFLVKMHIFHCKFPHIHFIKDLICVYEFLFLCISMHYLCIYSFHLRISFKSVHAGQAFQRLNREGHCRYSPPHYYRLFYLWQQCNLCHFQLLTLLQQPH